MYKVGDVIVFVSKEPILHLNRMFGYQDATVDAFSEYEFTGVITNVDLLDDEFYVSTLRPLSGLSCIVSTDKIIRFVEASALTDEERREVTNRTK